MTMKHPTVPGAAVVAPAEADDTAMCRPGGAACDAVLARHDARALIGPAGRALIALDGADYVLRITRAGKLILTK